MRSLNFGIQSDRKSAGADLSVEYYNFPVAEIFEFKVDPVPKLTFLNLELAETYRSLKTTFIMFRNKADK